MVGTVKEQGTFIKIFIAKCSRPKMAYNEKTGEVKDCIGKTSGLTKSEFMDFVADVQQWAAESLGIYVPEPNEEMELNFDN